MQNLIENSITRQWRVIFPNMLNANNTLFGGEIMKWMDELTFICATRFARVKLFTAYAQEVKFLKPVFVNDMVELIAKVEKFTAVKIFIKVEMYKEDKTTAERTKVAESMFVYVQLNDRMAPCRIKYPFDCNF